MPSTAVVAVCVAVLCIFIHIYILQPLFFSPLSVIPGPKLFALTKWPLAYEEWRGRRTSTINALHQTYGPVVRIAPNEISFNSLSALKTIYGAGSGFERTNFYDMFDVYGQKNLFTFHSVKEHADRKKLLAHAYSKSVMLKGYTAQMIRAKVKTYLDFIQKTRGGRDEIFTSLHYFAIDAISDFLYGPWGRTTCLEGNKAHQNLLNDILDVSRRQLSWFAVHFPNVTKWLYSRTGLVERIVSPLYPMQKPTTYSGIRRHALEAYNAFASYPAAKFGRSISSNLTILEHLYQNHESIKPKGLSDLDIASELADHLLAGIDTTSDTAMFLVWALSRPQNVNLQERLIEEVLSLPVSALDGNGIPMPDVVDQLPFLDAVIKETLRIYAPLPATEPRLYAQDCMIDEYAIPARTIVGMAPFWLHRNERIFRDPLDFNPKRWMDEDPARLVEMKRWWWAFSSGGRMCIGLQYVIHLGVCLLVSIAYSF
jgi:cytochrome P450